MNLADLLALLATIAGDIAAVVNVFQGMQPAGAPTVKPLGDLAASLKTAQERLQLASGTAANP